MTDDATQSAPDSPPRKERKQQFRRVKHDVHGWVVLDKPVGMTSTYAVSAVRRLFQAKRAGHAGTLDPLASGVLAIELAPGTGEYLAWFRKEQLHDVVWAGDPHKVVMGNDPRELSPRRSFAEWHQIVRDTASPWEPRELALARAVGASLTDLILQIRAVRVLIAENNQADLFISLHLNAAANGVTGLETYCLTPAGMTSTLTRNFADPANLVLPGNARDFENMQDDLKTKHSVELDSLR